MGWAKPDLARVCIVCLLAGGVTGTTDGGMTDGGGEASSAAEEADASVYCCEPVMAEKSGVCSIVAGLSCGCAVGAGSGVVVGIRSGNFLCGEDEGGCAVGQLAGVERVEKGNTVSSKVT